MPSLKSSYFSHLLKKKKKQFKQIKAVHLTILKPGSVIRSQGLLPKKVEPNEKQCMRRKFWKESESAA